MRSALPFILFAASASALAQDTDEVPGFDRPGIGFGTDTVRRGALAVELGFPSYLHDHADDGVHTVGLSSDLLLRTGLAPGWELQLSTSPWQRQRISSPQSLRSTRLQGAGDSHLAVKWAGPPSTDRTSWALLASAVIARGDADFSDGRQYALAASIDHRLAGNWSAALYASHQRGAGTHSTSWSPSLTLEVSDRLGFYLEAGFSHASNAPDETIAGAGVTWMLRRNVQLDASFDVGLDAGSPDLQAGAGVAIYLD